MTPRDRYAQCDETCTTDCGACKGRGRPAPVDALEASPAHAVALALDDLVDARIALNRARDIPTRSITALLEASQVRIDAGRAVWRAEDAYRDALDARYAEMNS